jgi:hypothetical protein
MTNECIDVTGLKLDELDIEGREFGVDVVGLESLTNIKVLRLRCCNLKFDVLTGRLKELRKIKFDCVNVIESTGMYMYAEDSWNIILAFLKELPELRELEVNVCCCWNQITVTGLAQIEKLDLMYRGGGWLTSLSVRGLESLVNLEELKLYECSINIDALTNLKKIRKLFLYPNVYEETTKERIKENQLVQIGFTQVIKPAWMDIQVNIYTRV